jgi:hypothetical protein
VISVPMMLSVNICIAHLLDLFEDGSVMFGGSTNSCCYCKKISRAVVIVSLLGCTIKSKLGLSKKITSVYKE